MKILLFLSLIISLKSFSQSIYGYLGKRVYVEGSLAASPAFFSRKTDGKYGFGFNIIGSLSTNIVLNLKQEIDLKYKRYSGVASIHSQGFGIVWRNKDAGWDMGEYSFSSNEYGLAYKYYLNNLGAPLGRYLSFGFGIAISRYYNPISVSNYHAEYDFSNGPNSYGYYLINYYFGTGPTNPQSNLIYRNSNKTFSPILRIGIGEQTIFANRFFYNYGVELGINLAYLGNAFIKPLQSKDYQQIETTQKEFTKNAKLAVQNRVFGMNILNFKMGIGILLF